MIIDAGQWESGLAKIEKQAAATGAAIAKKLTLPATIIGGAAGIGTSAIGGFLKPITDLVGGIPFIGGALAAVPLSAGGFESFIKSGIAEMKTMARTAHELGLSIEEMGGLFLKSGGDIDTAERAIFKLQAAVFEAAKDPEHAKKFQGIGLDPRALAGMSTFGMLGTIADQLEKAGSVLEKNAFLRDLFGKGGADMAKVFAGGSAGLGSASDKANLFGLVFDPSTIDKAGRALKEVDLLITGIRNQLAVAAAPWIEKLATWFKGLVTDAGGVPQLVEKIANTIIDFINTLTSTLGPLIDKLVDGGAAIDRLGLKATGNPILDAENAKAIQANADSLKGIFSIPQIPHIHLGGSDGGPAGSDGGPALAALQADQLAKGMEEVEKEFKDWVHTLEQSRQAIYDATTTPLEKFQQAMSDLDDIMAYTDATIEDYNRGVVKAFSDLEKASGVGREIHSGSLDVAGSEAAYRDAVESFNRAMQLSTASDPKTAIQQHQEQLQTQMLEELRRANQYLGRQTVPATANF